jgi:hypothetical protein
LAGARESGFVFIGMAAHWLLSALALAGIAYACLAAALVRNRNQRGTSNTVPLPQG